MCPATQITYFARYAMITHSEKTVWNFNDTFMQTTTKCHTFMQTTTKCHTFMQTTTKCHILSLEDLNGKYFCQILGGSLKLQGITQRTRKIQIKSGMTSCISFIHLLLHHLFTGSQVSLCVRDENKRLVSYLEVMFSHSRAYRMVVV